MAKIQKKSALIGVFILAAIAGIWRFVWQPSVTKEVLPEVSNMESGIPTPAPQQPVAERQVVSEENGTSKTATVKTSYKNPGGADDVAFSITVDASGVITTASIEVLAKNPTSIKRQEAFATDFPAAIQGKKISELNAIDRVGGSSLTTASFNASLAQLKAGI